MEQSAIKIIKIEKSKLFDRENEGNLVTFSIDRGSDKLNFEFVCFVDSRFSDDDAPKVARHYFSKNMQRLAEVSKEWEIPSAEFEKLGEP